MDNADEWVKERNNEYYNKFDYKWKLNDDGIMKLYRDCSIELSKIKKISVNNISIGVGEIIKTNSEVVFGENTSICGLLFSAENDKVATVDRYGDIRAVGVGTTKLIVKRK